MNWLAHLYLSEPTPAFRIGNLLPDLAPASELMNLPGDFRRGVEQHRRIDAFTDSHPIVRQSMHRISPPFRRFAGILVDVFYDHILAREWDSFSSVPLSDFAIEVYSSFECHRDDIPPVAYIRLEHMRAGDLLCSYRELNGISIALGRIASRLSRPVPLAEAVCILEADYNSFYSDFTTFFPELRSHVAPQPNAARNQIVGSHEVPS